MSGLYFCIMNGRERSAWPGFALTDNENDNENENCLVVSDPKNQQTKLLTFKTKHYGKHNF